MMDMLVKERWETPCTTMADIKKYMQWFSCAVAKPKPLSTHIIFCLQPMKLGGYIEQTKNWLTVMNSYGKLKVL